MSRSSNNLWLHRFAAGTAVATFLLLGAGGLVTSHGVGMAVPDWPNTYGYNMFFFPVSKWVGGVFYEHTHRLIASGVGLLTGILALWLYGKSARPFMRRLGLAFLVAGTATVAVMPRRWPDATVCVLTGVALFSASFLWPRGEPAAKWLRRLGWIAFLAVVLQGVLGGLRVVLFKDQIGIFHATLAQLFFALMCAIALFTSRWWERWFSQGDARKERGAFPLGSARHWILGTTALILLQLILGATMRHQHAGLAIRDFPLAYGKAWPATDPESVARYNEERVEITAANPITAFQIELQMVHRIVAVLILAGAGVCLWKTRRLANTCRGAGSAGSGKPPAEAGREIREAAPSLLEVMGAKLGALQRLSWFWLGLIVVQATLGALTILTNKAADIATAHVLVGALSLATGAISCIIVFLSPEFARRSAALSASSASSAAAAAQASSSLASPRAARL